MKPDRYWRPWDVDELAVAVDAYIEILQYEVENPAPVGPLRNGGTIAFS